MDEHPTAADIAPGRTGNYKWFSGQWHVSSPPAADHYATAKGALVVGLDGDIVSVPFDFSPGVLPVLSGEKGFYVEFEARLSDNDPDHFPALWLMPVEHNRAKDDSYEGDPPGFERWVEFDVDEGGFGPGHAGTVHSWSGVYPNYQGVINRNGQSKLPLDRTRKHNFGMSFNPIGGEVTWWIDGRKQQTAQMSDLGRIARKQRFYLLIGAQSHGKRLPYAMTVSRVRAFLPN